MQIKAHELERHLSQTLAHIYVLSGDEPLQLEEALDYLRETAREKGFNEKIRFDIGPKFEWQTLEQEIQSMSLFSEKRIFDLRLSTNNLSERNAKILESYARSPNQDNLLVISARKIDANTKRRAWYKTIEKNGVTIQFWPVEQAHLPQWIKKRASKYNLKITNDAALLLADKVEGNLVACAQELKKLDLLHSTEIVELKDIIQLVSDNTHFSVFDCVEAALKGDGRKVIRIIQSLRDDGTEPILLAWALTRELRLLEELAREKMLGVNLSSLFSRHRIWAKRQQPLLAALKSHSQEQLESQIKGMAKLDMVLKSASQNSVWDELTYVCIRLAGMPIRPVKAYN